MRLGAIHRAAPSGVPFLSARARLSRMTPPKSVDWHLKCPPDGDALGNDLYGCCVPAETYREIQMRRANAWGDTWKPTEADVLARYAALTGFNVATGQPDQGTDTAAETADYCTRGVRLDSQTVDIPHWTLIDPTKTNDMKLAIAHLCAIALTAALPIGSQDMDFAKPPGSGPDWVAGSWGVHRILSGKYDGDVFTIRTWGLDYPVHPEWMQRYVIAAEVRVSRTWTQATGLTPSGLDWDGLIADAGNYGKVA